MSLRMFLGIGRNPFDPGETIHDAQSGIRLCDRRARNLDIPRPLTTRIRARASFWSPAPRRSGQSFS